MARKSNRAVLVLTQEQSTTLKVLAASRTAPAREVERAKVLLGYAGGSSITELQRQLGSRGGGSPGPGRCLLARALGRDFKGKFSVIAYAVAIPLAFASPWLANAVYVLVALWWLVPDRRIERVLTDAEEKKIPSASQEH